MTFNPLWLRVENFNGAPMTFVTGASARGSSGNTHQIWIRPDAPIVESTSTPVYTNTFNITTPAIRTSNPTGFFGPGAPTIENSGMTGRDWLIANAQWRITDVSSLFYNLFGFAANQWYDFTSGGAVPEMSYAGGGQAPYTIQIRNKFTGAVLVSEVFSLTAA